MNSFKKLIASTFVVSSLIAPSVVIADDGSDVEVIELESVSSPNVEQANEAPKPNTRDAATARRNAERILTDALYSLQDFELQKNYAEIEKDLRSARAILIFPDVINASFFVGVGSGKGILLARSKDGKWTYPAFYTFSLASLGIQFGADSSQIAMVVMNGKGLGSLITDKFQVGATFKGAIGNEGEQVGVSTTSNMEKDIKTYAVSKGAFLGVALDGVGVEPDNELNRAYYGRDDASTQTIVIDGQYSNKHADA
ncbi:MAG: lipid-binding SYLF domain-containing protein, partial [Alphaproteobacteria bacterium]